MRLLLLAAGLAAGLLSPATAGAETEAETEAEAETEGETGAGQAALPAGLLAAPNRQTLPTITLSAGQPLGEPWVLRSGGYYRVTIEADGSQELALSGPAFFRAIWIDEVVIEGIEVRPVGLDSLEFDEAGEARLTFIAIRPGSYVLETPQGGAAQALQITIE